MPPNPTVQRHDKVHYSKKQKTKTTPSIARRVDSVSKQAGLLAQASSFLFPSRFPSGSLQKLLYYSGGTAWDFHPLPLSSTGWIPVEPVSVLFNSDNSLYHNYFSIARRANIEVHGSFAMCKCCTANKPLTGFQQYDDYLSKINGMTPIVLICYAIWFPLSKIFINHSTGSDFSKTMFFILIKHRCRTFFCTGITINRSIASIFK